MNIGMRAPRRRIGGVISWWVLALVLGFGPRAEAAKFYHASFGAMQIYSSDNPDHTRRLVGELLEIRRRIQELVAPVTLPNPRLQILVFNRQKDYEEFLPEKARWDKTSPTMVSGFNYSEQALAAAIVREGPAYEFGQEAVRLFYANYLLSSALPDAPIWIKIGLPEFFATTDYRGSHIYVGADFLDHAGNVRLSKLIPLADLMNDEAMRKYDGVLRHDNVLYHESWALWHRWLTDPDPHRREQIVRLFAAIRAGGKGDLESVTASFGETAEAIDAERRSPARGRRFAVVESNGNPDPLLNGLQFSPATPLDAVYAQALLAGSVGRGPAQLGYELYRLADTEPASPRPAEALAILAMGDQDMPAAAARWEKAREQGTGNAFAYLLPAREALWNRSFTLAPQAQLPVAPTLEWRQLLARAVELDPGNLDAQYFRVLVEAYAPVPDAAIVDAVARSEMLQLRPLGYLYLALARWRVGQTEEATKVLLAARENRRLNAVTLQRVDSLLAGIRQDEARKK